MSGLNWEKAAKNAKADKRATGLDLLRNPADEMSEITRLQQARQKKNRPTPRAKLDVVDVAPELAGQAVGEAIQRGRLIDKALTFEERKAAALKRHAEKTGKPLPETKKPQSKKAPHKADQAEKKQRRAVKAERSKRRAEWRKTLPPEQAEAKINQLKAETKAARKSREKVDDSPPW
ncbi:hypothetical protein [Aeromonas sp. 6P]|uniref:hypothetical protein n=1 Tax=Aeromonas sp. 6P TaxID=3452722 RepID=UPI003F7908A8